MSMEDAEKLIEDKCNDCLSGSVEKVKVAPAAKELYEKLLQMKDLQENLDFYKEVNEKNDERAKMLDGLNGMVDAQEKLEKDEVFVRPSAADEAKYIEEIGLSSNLMPELSSFSKHQDNMHGLGTSVSCLEETPVKNPALTLHKSSVDDHFTDSIGKISSFSDGPPFGFASPFHPSQLPSSPLLISARCD